ncbi:hypothetical protein D9M71_587480 [compost metagenome]
MVFKWRKRYQEAGLEGLSDLRRSGAPRKLDAAKIKETLTLTTQRVPREATPLEPAVDGQVRWGQHLAGRTGVGGCRLQAALVENLQDQ